MKLKCEICKDGEKFECDSPYEMIDHLEEHWKAINWLCDKLTKEKFQENTKNELCPITGKKGYVKEEDCHCFCCGKHEGEIKYG